MKNKEFEKNVKFADYEIVKFEFPDIFDISIGKVMIAKRGNDVYLSMDQEVNKEYITKIWNPGVGKMLRNDIKKNNLDCYYEVNYKNMTALCKKIHETDENYELEKTMPLMTLLGETYVIVRNKKRDDAYVIKDKLVEDFEYTPSEEDADENEPESIELF